MVKNTVAKVLVVALAVLAVAACVRHYRKSRATALMQEYLLVPVEGRQLATMPQGMPGNGHSGRATNEEDYTDPYGGGDVPGPYGHVNDPYDGDWALGPLGGKAVNMQGLRMVNPAQAALDRNIWDSNAMGTNSIFMGNMPVSAVEKVHKQQEARAKAAQMMQDSEAKLHAHEDTRWIGTNAAFFGSNGGGTGLARGAKKGLAHKLGAKKASPHHKAAAPAKGKVAVKAKTTSLFRSDNPHEAEYGREGDHILDESVLPSDIGSGGPVIGVDGLPSNGPHEWVHVDEPFSFACNPDIYGCEKGLTVDPLYANDR
eukprot:CAMPEP_0114141048 /NCGR_PEP_ID=MMETSP0043_2-20121206/17708_1 /TAXON_ID=464988 /ORGANISM="Hemiselmis andersenii, Strain CCMP644" /LENGTH=313 /DNA_ID=CAMNT_0001235179 /DNA_START=9 /DNA_END=950 /DNA_ORIENTATION=-